MATNPMQRKARNSFLLGMLVMLLITGGIIAFLILQLTNMKKAEEKDRESKIKVYALKKDINSGDEITQADLEEKEVEKSAAPTDYITKTFFAESTAKKNVVKISMTKGTVVSKKMINSQDYKLTDDVRKQEYNMFILPTDLQNGDFIDVRLLLPTGTDYIVDSKKRVEIPEIAGVDSTDTISIELSEEEINTLSNAIVDAFKVEGAKLYVNKYTDPGMQEAATPTYPISREVMELINSNPNVVDEARKALWNRYNNNKQADQRNSVINPQVSGSDADKNLQDEMQQSIENSTKTRQEYLQGLTSTTTNSTK